MLCKKGPKALLVLEDGTAFSGHAFAGKGMAFGEVVFNTGMAGYQEILTDPSYKGQILTMTYPLIGNYGVNGVDMESLRIHMEGFIVREYQPDPSNWRSEKSLKTFLEEHGKIGIEGIDTRALTKRIRTQGAMRGVISTETDNTEELLHMVRKSPGLTGLDLVTSITCKNPYEWKADAITPFVNSAKKTDKPRVVVLDCGVKFNILRELEKLGCEVIVVPATTNASGIFSFSPDGFLLSNGPGDPAPLTYIISTVKELLGKLPIFGICLGHQMLGQALGATTKKLKFGHHGVNQPVKNLMTGRVEITSQNHGFMVEKETLPAYAEITHINLNDGTLEGIACPSLKAFSVQYHPEACPGPNDAHYLFLDFLRIMSVNV